MEIAWELESGTEMKLGPHLIGWEISFEPEIREFQVNKKYRIGQELSTQISQSKLHKLKGEKKF